MLPVPNLTQRVSVSVCSKIFLILLSGLVSFDLIYIANLMRHFTVWLWLGSVSISRVHRAALFPPPSLTLPYDRVGFIYGAAAKVTVEHWPDLLAG